jgi:hypothetical protein
MKKFACLFVALLGLALTADTSRAADWGSAHYGGYQPWWNIFAKRNHCMSAEEERLQRFWHDYYDALRRYYGMLDRIDWVAYYKNHGYQINNGGYGCGPGGGSQRIQFAPVFVSPTMQWAVPQGMLSGAPCGPGMPPPGAFQTFPTFGGHPGMGGGMMPTAMPGMMPGAPGAYPMAGGPMPMMPQ